MIIKEFSKTYRSYIGSVKIGFGLILARFRSSNKAIMLFFFLITLSANSYTQKNTLLNSDNIGEMLVKAHKLEIEIGETELVDEVLYFIKKNKIKFDDLYTQGLVFYLKGIQLTHFQNFDLAEIELKKAAEIFRSLNKNSDYVLALDQLGTTRSYLDDYKGALEYGLLSLSVCNKIEDYGHMIDLHFNMSLRYARVKEWEKSKIQALNSIELIKKLKRKKKRLKFLYSFVAKAEMNTGNYQNAKVYIDSVRLFIVGKKDYLVLRSLHTVYGEYYEKMGDFSLSSENYQKAYKNSIGVIKYKQSLLNKSSLVVNQLQEELNLNKEKIIEKQKESLRNTIIFILILFLCSSWLVWLYRNQKKSLFQIELLNGDLTKSNFLIEESNNKLKQKNSEIKNLLYLNEKTLFSRELKISTLKDAIRKIEKNIIHLMDLKSTVNNVDLIKINHSLENLIDENEIWEDFKFQFEKIRPGFFIFLKEQFPDLTTNDLKHSSYVVSKLKSKEVAKLLNISTRSVETARHRLKKKLNLIEQESLSDFLFSKVE